MREGKLQAKGQENVLPHIVWHRSNMLLFWSIIEMEFNVFKYLKCLYDFAKNISSKSLDFNCYFNMISSLLYA